MIELWRAKKGAVTRRSTCGGGVLWYLYAALLTLAALAFVSPVQAQSVPTLTLSVAPTTIYEDPGTATVTVATSDNSPVTDAQTITLTLAGTATEGTDYNIASKTLTLAANSASVTTTITALTDSATEGDETVLVTATTGSTTIGSQQTVTIKDPPALTVSMPPEFASRVVYVVEGSSLDVPVLLSGAPGRAVTITMVLRRRRNTSSSDYTVSPLALTFGPTETRKTVTVTATDDSEADPDDLISLDVPGTADLPAGITDPSLTTTTVVIVDNDFEYQVSHAGGTTLAVDEDAGTLTATVRVRTPGSLTPNGLAALNENVVLSVSTADGTATAGQDYTALSQTLTFAPSDFAAQNSGCVPSSGSCARAEKTVTVPITDDAVYEGATPETFTLTLSHGSDQRVTYPSGASATVSITDDDVPALTLLVAPTMILESGGMATVTVATADNTAVTADLTVALALAGTATEGTDYSIASKTLTLANGQSSVTTTITAMTDDVTEGDETVLVTATTGTTTIGSQQTVTIKDLPARTVTVLDPVPGSDLLEGGDSVTVPVVLSGAPGRDVTITMTVEHLLGASLSDYTASPLSLTFGPEETRKEVTVTATEDTEVDLYESVRLVIDAGTLPAGITIFGQYTARLYIVDNDFDYEVSLVGGPALAVDEGSGTLTATVRVQTPENLTQAAARLLNETVTLTVSTADGTATAGQDYTALSAQTLTFETSNFTDFSCPGGGCLFAEMTVSVPITDDTVHEGATPETFTLTLSHGSDQRVTYPSGSTATVSITGDDAVPTLTVSVSPAAIAEAMGSSTVTVSTGGTSFTTDQTIALALTGTATKGDDYTISAEPLVLTAGETSVSATVTAVDDQLDDDAETVVITASHNSTNIGTLQTITITDDDDTRILSIAGTDASESAGNMVFTISVSETSLVPVSVNWATAAILSQNLIEPEDFTVSSGTVTIAAGQTSTTVSVPIANDRIDEPAEIIRVNLDAPGATGVTVGLGPSDSDRFAEASILDDDLPPSPSISVNNAGIAEAGGQAIVTIGTGSGSTFESEMVYVLTLSGAGTRNVDYTIGETTLTLPAGVGANASQAGTTLTAIQDRIDEPDEAVVLTAGVGSVTVTIGDDDDAPAPSFTVDAASIGEADGSATLTVSTGSGSTYEQAQTIVLSLAGPGTATEADDFTILSKSLTLPAGTGMAARSITTTVTAVQDKIDEPDETILIDAKRGTGGLAPAVGSQLTVTVTDDDAEPLLTFTTNNASIAEDAGSATLTVSTGSGSTYEQAQTIVLSLAPAGTATETDDFTIQSKSLTLPAGTSTAASSIDTTVTAVQDTIDEPDETILIDAKRGTGGSPPAVGSQLTVTVADDDAAPGLSLEVSEATLDEAGGRTTVTVSTGTGSTFETDQVLTLTLGGTATATDDYTIGANELTLPAGVGTEASEITTVITAVDDDFFEGTTNEQLTVTGSRGGAGFGSMRVVTIVENEEPPTLTLTLGAESISEDGGTTTVTASVSPRTVDAFAVTFAVTPNAPATAADYDLTGELAFAALSATPTGTVTITANNNRVDRPDKTVSVIGTSSQSYFRPIEAVTLTIEDEDDPPAPVLEVTAADIAENGGESTVTVTTGDGSTFPEAMTVLLTMTGAATENVDYRIVSKSLTLPAGSGLDVSMVSTTVTGIDDIIDDDAEDILIDAAIGAAAVGTQQGITITDDDAAPVPTLGVSPGSISENGGVSTVTVTTSSGNSTFATDQTITLTLAGTAVEDEDYTITSKTLTLLAGVGMNHAQVTASVTGLNDAIDETDRETVLIDAARATGTNTSVPVGTRQTVEVEDDDGAPVLEFRASSTQIGENGGVSTLTVTTGGGSTFEEEQTITLTVAEGGTAVEDSDYGVGPTSLTLPAGEGLNASVVTTTVTGLNDANYEGTADQTMTISAAHGAEAVGAPITIGVKDDEPPSQTQLVLSRTSISEDSDADNGASLISATVSPPSEVGFWIKTCFTGPTTRMNWLARYGIGNCGYVEFRAEETSSVTTRPGARFFGKDNETADGDAVITISGEVTGFDTGEFADLPNPLPGIRAPAPVTLTIEDDDRVDTTVTLSVDTAEVNEGGGATVITVTGTLSGNTPTGDTTVTLSVDSGAGGSGAQAGADFTPVEDFVLTIGTGDTSATATFTLTPTDDIIDEPAEALTLSGSPGSNNVGMAGTVAITIADNDAAPALVLSVQPASIAEAGDTSTVTVSTGTGSTFTTDQAIALALTGTATQGGDYTIEGTSLVLPAGSGGTDSSVSTTITGVDDAEADPGETVIVTGSVGGVDFGAAQTVTITDDEGAAEVTLVLTPEAVFEGGTSTVSARVSPVSAVAFDVTVSAAGVAPADAGDFTLNGTTLSFAAGAAQSTGAVTIDATDDSEDSEDKTVTVTGTVSAAVVTGPAAVALTIRDDEDPVTLSLEVSADSISEDGGTATVTVSTATDSTFSTEQVITLEMGGTAAPGADYTIGSTTLSLAAGASSVTTTVTGLADEVFEGEETVTISALLDGIDFGTERTITLTDGDTAPTVTLVLTPDAISENNGASAVTATLSGPSEIPLDVTVSAEAVAPAVAADFGLSGSTLSFAANATASTGAVTVTGVDNVVDAPDKQVRIQGSVSDPRFTAPQAALLTLEDDDEASNTVTITVEPAEVGEGSEPAELTVTATFSAGARQTASDFVISVLSGVGEDAAQSGIDFADVSDFNLTIPANETTGTATFTLAPLPDIISEGPEVLSISVSSAKPDIGVAETPTVTLTDDDAAPSPVLVVSPASMAESGGTATVTISTGTDSTYESGQTITLTLAGTATEGSDYAIGSTTLILPAGSGEAASSVTTSLSALDDIVDEAAETVEVSAAIGDTGIGTGSASITDDDAAPVLVLTVNPGTIRENGGTATVTVSTGAGSTFVEEQTITLALAGTAALGDDYTLSSDTLTLPAGEGFDASSVTAEIVAVDDTFAEGDETVEIDGVLDGNRFGAAQTLTIADDEGEARVLLVLSTPSVREDGGTATLRAVVSPAARERFTVTVTVTAAPGGTGNFVLTGPDGEAGGDGVTLTFEADAMESSGAATITAVDNNRLDGDRVVTVSGAVSLDRVQAPPDVTLTILDDDAPPAVTLVLTPASIDENGGVSRVTAVLNTAVAEPFTVTVSAAAVEPAKAGDFILAGTGGAAAVTLSFAADATESSGEVTITAVDNDEDAPDKTVTVSGSVSLDGVAAPAAVTLTIADDDEEVTEPPAVTLLLTPASIDENGGVSRVTATVSPASPEAFTVTVSAAAVEPAKAGDFTLAGTGGAAAVTLSFAAGATESGGEVTITAVDNDEDAPDRTVTVSGTVSLDGVAAPAAVTLTIADDDEEVTEPPAVTLLLTPASIDENGGVSRVTATVSPASPEAFTVTVSAAAVEPAKAGDFTLAGTGGAAAVTLSFAADATESSGEVTITAVDNDEDAPDRRVTVTGSVSLEGVAGPAAVTLTIADDDEEVTEPPVVTLVLTPASIDENGGVSRVTATVSPASPEAFTVTVSAAAVEPAKAGDFVLVGTGGAVAVTLSFAAGATESSGEVTITAVDNDEDAPDRRVTVTGSVSLEGVAAPAAVTLTIADDDEEVTEPPVVTLVLTPASIDENGGVSRVTATVSPASPEAFTVTVSAAAVEPAKAGDFVLAGTGGAEAVTLSFAAGATESSGEVTITAVDNDEDAPDRTVTVTGSVSLEGVAGPAAVALTIADDDDEGVTEPSVVTLVLTPASIDENGGVSRVTATVSPAVAEPFTVTVSAAAVEPAKAGDFTLVGTGGAEAVTLSFAAGATESSGEVTITAVDNGEDAPDKTVTVTGSVSLEGVAAPAAVTLTIADDDEEEGVTEPPVVTLVLTPSSIDENGGVSRVTATVSPASPEAFTVTVSAAAVEPAKAGDFILAGTGGAAAVTLSFAAGATESSGEVTITAVDDDEVAPDRRVTVSGSVSLEGVAGPAAVALTIADDDDEGVTEPSVVTLVLTPSSIDENGGVSRVTATVSPSSAEAFTVTVSAAAVEPAKAGDFILAGTGGAVAVTLSFAAGATESSGEVTITAVDDDEVAPDKTVTVSGSVSLEGVAGPAAVTLTIAGDDGVEIAPSEVTIGEGDEAGGTYTVKLDVEPTADVTVTVSVPSGRGVAVSPATLTFTADNWQTAQTVTVTAIIDNDADDQIVTITHAVAGGGYEDVTVADVSVMITDLVDPMPMPKAWITRFGRTVAEQVLDAVEARREAAPKLGVEASLAGQRIGGAGLPENGAGRQEADHSRSLSDWLNGETDPQRQNLGSRTITERELLTGSSFTLTAATQGSGLISIWGRGAVTNLTGREGDLTVDGEVASGMLGADWTVGAWKTGLLVSHSLGDGDYRGASEGTVASTLTGIFPWVRRALSERLSVWGVAGYGKGSLTLEPEGEPKIRTDLDLWMAAAGLRGVLVDGGHDGPTLAAGADAMIVQTSSDAVSGGSGNLAAEEAGVSRLRFGLTGSQPFRLAEWATLTPSVEIGVRHDGGDAETGLGVDIGGGLAWSDTRWGIAAEFRGRGLLTHEADGFRERGLSGSLSWDLQPASDWGPRASLTQTLGGSAGGGMNELLSRDTLTGLAANDNGDDLQRRLEARFGYGFAAFGGRFTSLPEIAVGLSDAGYDYSLGWRLVRGGGPGGGALELSVEARRRDSANDDIALEHQVGFRVNARF